MNFKVINHLTQEDDGQVRNVLVESARIVRGHVQDLKTLNASHYAGLIVAGGFGVAKNLSNFMSEKENFNMQVDFEAAVKAFKHDQKPAGYMCIAPAWLPKIYENVQCTIGSDEDISAVINKMGG